MTGPVTTEALVERERQELVGLSNHLRGEGHLIDAENIRKALSDNELLAENCRGNAALATELRRRLDAAEAALQQVTAERDEAVNKANEEEVSAAWDKAMCQIAENEAARLRAEGEAKDRALLLLLPFVDYAAGEGLMFVETEDGEHPEMDAADIVIAAAKEIGLELGSDASEAFLAAGYDAIRAARAATAREG